MSRTSWRLISGACCLAMCGCGPTLPPTAPVHGRVAVAGKPVTMGRIMFQPENGRPATGAIQTDGTYRLTTFQKDDGAVLGRHRVTIEAFEAPSPPAGRAGSFEEEVRGGRTLAGHSPARSAVRWIVPEKFARRDSSPLRADIKPTDNTCNFDLP
jgi:hypothetical protein